MTQDSRPRPIPSTRFLLVPVIACALIVASVGAAFAQATLDTLPVQYRLDKGSSYQEGCFGPCLCPVLINQTLRGTYVLTPRGFDGLFTTYAVTDVNWLVNLNGTDTFVTGSGTYRIGGEFALQQEMTLDLKVGDNKVAQYTSGLLTGPAPFPTINIDIHIATQTCNGVLFGLRSSPVPPDQIRPYQLLSGSTFQRGCFGLCDCLVGPLLPMMGRFALIPLASEPPWNDFAIVNARFKVSSPSLTPSAYDAQSVRGAGFYRFGGAPSQQRLEMLLTVDREAPARFDSGLVPGGDRFPRIDAKISVGGMVCFDTVLDLHAAPRDVKFGRPTRSDGDTP